MGKRRKPTPDEDLMEMVQRLMKKPEALRASLRSDTWRAFLRETLHWKEFPERSLAAVDYGRLLVYETLPQYGIRFHREISKRGWRYMFTDLRTGRMIKWDVVRRAIRISPKEVETFPYFRMGEWRVGLRHPITKKIIYAP